MGVEADWVTYTTLMDLCAEARQGMRAVELLQVCFLCFCVAYGSLLFGLPETRAHVTKHNSLKRSKDSTLLHECSCTMKAANPPRCSTYFSAQYTTQFYTFLCSSGPACLLCICLPQEGIKSGGALKHPRAESQTVP